MRYPIILDGEAQGWLDVYEDGPRTIFKAVCADPGRLVRLSVYGECEGYLGVMEPEAGRLHLHRSLTKLAMRDFPQSITHAAPEGEPPAKVTAMEPEPDETAEAEPAQEDGETVWELTTEAPPTESLPTETPPQICVAADDTDLLWLSAPNGSLTTSWQGRDYLAIPVAADGLPMFRSLERREIDGASYAIFETKNGKVL